jgi:oxygen-independent coproporphyrinogen-3 oxidase
LTDLALEARARAAEAGSRAFDTFYLGGGTPSILSSADLEALLRALRGVFEFAAAAETTLEANPNDVNGDSARAWRGLGFDRVSLGAQSFNDAALERLGRSHRAADTETAFEGLRKAGFENISLDLMLSLPRETAADARRSLERAVTLGPEHLSLYELVVEPRTFFGHEARGARLELPSEEESLETLLSANEILERSGYRRYELLSWAKPGFESRHNTLYWTGGEYLGLGPGAHSYLGGRRSCLAKTVDRWYAKTEAGDWTPDEFEALAPPAREREAFLLALRLADGAAKNEFPGRPDIGGLIERGLLEEDGERVRLTARGRLLAESVFAELAL